MRSGRSIFPREGWYAVTLLDAHAARTKTTNNQGAARLRAFIGNSDGGFCILRNVERSRDWALRPLPMVACASVARAFDGARACRAILACARARTVAAVEIAGSCRKSKGRRIPPRST